MARINTNTEIMAARWGSAVYHKDSGWEVPLSGNESVFVEAHTVETVRKELSAHKMTLKYTTLGVGRYMGNDDDNPFGPAVSRKSERRVSTVAPIVETHGHIEGTETSVLEHQIRDLLRELSAREADDDDLAEPSLGRAD